MPRPRWVRPRSARWNAWLWQFASPGIVSPGSRVASIAGDRRSVAVGCTPTSVGPSRCDGSEPAVLDLDEHVVVDGAVDPGALEEVRRGVAHRASRSRVSASASTPARQSAISACSAGRVRDAGRVADEEHRARDPLRRQDAGVVAGLRRDDRPVAALVVARRSARRGPGSKSTAPETDSAVTVSDVPSRSARSSACRVIVATRSARASSLSHRASIQAVTAEGTELVELGVVSTRPKVARCPATPGLLVGGERRHRVGQHRVRAVLHPRRAGVVGLAGDVEAVAPVRPDPARHPDRARRGRRGRGPARRAARRSTPMREESSQGWGFSTSSPAEPIASSSAYAVAGRAARGPATTSVAPVASREPRQASPNRDPSSSTNTDTPIGRAGRNPRSRSRSTAASADTTPSGPSYAPPSSTESRCDPVTTPGRIVPDGGSRPDRSRDRRDVPPRDEVAEGVGLEPQRRGPRPARRTTPRARARRW